jgi:hypothetical protein
MAVGYDARGSANVAGIDANGVEGCFVDWSQTGIAVGYGRIAKTGSRVRI